MLLILIAFVGLVFVSASAEFLRRARWIDRLALFAIIALAISTQPSFSHHRIEMTNAITSPHGSPGVMMGGSDRAAMAANVTARLEHSELLVLSFTTLDGDIASVGAFGRVFVFGR
jgi:hypothetical protein